MVIDLEHWFWMLLIVHMASIASTSRSSAVLLVEEGGVSLLGFIADDRHHWLIEEERTIIYS